MGIFGTLVKGAMGGYPTIPDYPDPAFADIGESQSQSIRSNQASIPDLIAIGEDVNKYNIAERAKALTAGIPGYSEITNRMPEILNQQLRGELPDDVASQIMRRSNSRAFAGGYGGSGAGDNLAARDLGLSSLAMIQQGQAFAPSWLQTMNSVAVPPQFQIESGFITPGQAHQATQWNELQRVDAEWMQNILDSIPDPEKAALAESVGGIADIVGTVILAAAGGAIGGMAGGAMGGAAGGGSTGSMFGSQLGGMIGGAGGGGQSGSEMGNLVGSLMQQRSAPSAPSNMVGTYPGGYYGYPQAGAVQQVSPLGASTYNPSMLGGYNYGGFGG